MFMNLHNKKVPSLFHLNATAETSLYSFDLRRLKSKPHLGLSLEKGLALTKVLSLKVTESDLSFTSGRKYIHFTCPKNLISYHLRILITSKVIELTSIS